jgi:hypothetical protein
VGESEEETGTDGSVDQVPANEGKSIAESREKETEEGQKRGGARQDAPGREGDGVVELEGAEDVGVLENDGGGEGDPDSDAVSRGKQGCG